MPDDAPATPILDRIASPADLRSLPPETIAPLAREIRTLLTHVVGRTGGHLASNLGIVELTLALHRVFDFDTDRLCFDVGHQCYVHKLLTGRRGRFGTLRQTGGLSGFPNPRESGQDPFRVGHASTAISSALGLATGLRLRGEARKVVAVVGDGAIGGGLSFEALNHAGQAGEDVIVILNDNEMAIAPTVGAFSTFLTDLRANPAAHRLREDVRKALQSVPLIGGPLETTQEHLLGLVKGAVESGHVFTALGFRYYGPVDGHDAALLERELRNLRRLDGPRLLHVMTRKGHGFDAAAADPETFHSAVPFELRGTEIVREARAAPGWTDVFVERLRERAREDERIVALTAAMPAGTGIKSFAAEFPDRFLDVGIAEGHCLTCAAGLARAGLVPVVAIYSTFLQRAYDHIIHDCAAQEDLHIVFALDRAGLVGPDGPTHHGVFDIAFLRHVPGLTLCAPRDAAELRAMLDWAIAAPGLVAIRYPRGSVPPEESADRPPIRAGVSETLREGADGTVLAYGRMVAPALAAARRLAEEPDGPDLAVVNARFAAPLDRDALRAAAERSPLLVTVEDHVLAGGFGSAVAEACADRGVSLRLVRLGVPDRFVSHGAPADLDRELGLDAGGLAAAFRRAASGAGAGAPASSAAAPAG